LEAVSVALGEYDRQLVSTTNQGSRLSGQVSRTISTQRQRVLPAGDVANIPTGRALHLDGIRWELLTVTPAFRTEPWRTLTQLPATATATTTESNGTSGPSGPAGETLVEGSRR
jgi:hypothetical protein